MRWMPQSSRAKMLSRHNPGFVMIMDSGEERVAAFVQEHRRRLRVRRRVKQIPTLLGRAEV